MIEKGGMTSHRIPGEPNPTFCVFEHVYFARPDSLVNGKSVYRARERMGQRLAQEAAAERAGHLPVASRITAEIDYQTRRSREALERLVDRRLVLGGPQPCADPQVARSRRK